MARVAEENELFQYFFEEMREEFWGNLYERTQGAWKKYFEADSERQRDSYAVVDAYERDPERRTDYRNGYYERDFQTRFGTLRLRIARTRKKNFLPKGLESFQRRAEEVSLLIREMFLRGMSTREAGRLIAILTGEPVSAQTVSTLTRNLDAAVKQFHEAPLGDDWEFLYLDGVSLRIRRPSGRKRVQMLVALGVRADGSRQLLAFMHSQGESQGAWESLLQDLYRRGLTGRNLKLIVTDGCPGLAAAIQVVYPRAQHQRCWVHKMRNILDKVRRADHDAVKRDAQAIYSALSLREAQIAFRRFKSIWQNSYPQIVQGLDRDLPELLAFYSFKRSLWKTLRTTNLIERRFVEVRRRTRPMVCFVNIRSVDRIIYSIFTRFNLNPKNQRPQLTFTQAA